jgi:hypothetical protein
MILPTRCKNISGTTILELIIAMFIGSLVIAGGYRFYRSFNETTTREKLKAELQQDITMVSNLIERDIRMAGCGLPGNGVTAVLADNASDQLSLFINENRRETTLTAVVQPAHTTIYIADATGFVADGWVCLARPATDTIYRRIVSISNNGSSPETLVMDEAATSGPFDIATTRVFPATRVRYNVSGSPLQLQRGKNGVTVPVGGKLDSINIVPKNGAKVPVVCPIDNASILTVVIGRHIGNGGNRFFMADSTEINMRNIN